MGSMTNVIDADFLSSHPEGDTLARLTLREDAPRHVLAAVDGPDKTITIDAAADNYMDLLVALEALNSEQTGIVFTAQWVENIVTAAELEAISTGSDAEDVLNHAVTAINNPFITFSAPLTFILDEAGDQKVSIHLAVTAPSIYTGMQALRHLTAPRVLEDQARSLSPQPKTASA